jgi:predicted unusual protein kinase regulating ubiquinone biosynthesis (AarF/ABC1/UbiB family)
MSKLPTGRLARFARLARLGARTGASALFSRDGVAAATDAADVLGTLRGLSAKVGQMASYIDGMVPEPQRAAYENGLRVLRDAAPRSPPAAIKRRVEEELGAPIDRLFARWEDEPFASASIGQVHAALLDDGTEVAVKVQHPGIERAIESDLDNASMLEAAVRALGPRGLGTKAAFDVLRARFREELDYELEAERQRFFRRLHAGDPTIHVPRVFDERSSGAVLTTERVRGATLEAAAQEPPPARLAYAETLWRFVFKGNMVGGLFNADPHPGNYVFQRDGVVSFLDFGCVQPIPEEHQRQGRAAHVAAIDRDDRAFDEAVRRMLGLRGGRYEAFAIAYTRQAFAPLWRSPFRITSPYVAGLVHAVRDVKLDLVRDPTFVAMPPSMIFMNRLQFGFYSVLARLDVEVDYCAVERDFLSAAA